MSYDLKQFQDPRLIDFFLNNLKSESATYFEQYGDKKKIENYFYHSHEKTSILKPPRVGDEKNISRNGIPKMHIFGNAVRKLFSYKFFIINL